MNDEDRSVARQYSLPLLFIWCPSNTIWAWHSNEGGEVEFCVTVKNSVKKMKQIMINIKWLVLEVKEKCGKINSWGYFGFSLYWINYPMYHVWEGKFGNIHQIEVSSLYNVIDIRWFSPILCLWVISVWGFTSSCMTFYIL
jgi:hypothetical protein